jgi:drug/metabolite transporter (DMT)-like permease
MMEDRGARAPHPAPSRARLYGLLGVMLLIWAANFIFAKLAVRDAPALLVAALRTVLSGIVMIPVYRLAGPGADPALRPWTRRDLPRLAAIGVLGIVANQFAFVVALSYTSVAHGSVVGTMAPVLVLLGAAALGQERLSGRRVGGMIAAAAGVVLLQLHRGGDGQQSSAVGDLVMLLNAALFAAFSLFGKSLTAEVGTLAVNAVAFWGGALLSFPFAVWGLWQVGGPGQISAAAWAGIVYMAIAPSVVGYLIYSHALRYLPASRVASFTYLQPILATLLAVALLGERPGIGYFGAAAVILGGVWLVQRE